MGPGYGWNTGTYLARRCRNALGSCTWKCSHHFCCSRRARPVPPKPTVDCTPSQPNPTNALNPLLQLLYSFLHWRACDTRSETWGTPGASQSGGGLEGLSCSGATIANDYTCTALLSSRYVCAAKNAKKIKAQKKCKKSLALPALHCGAVHKKQWEVVGGSALCQDLPPVCLSSPSSSSSSSSTSQPPPSTPSR